MKTDQITRNRSKMPPNRYKQKKHPEAHENRMNAPEEMETEDRG